jgi:hypothetical protein
MTDQKNAGQPPERMADALSELMNSLPWCPLPIHQYSEGPMPHVLRPALVAARRLERQFLALGSGISAPGSAAQQQG